MKGAGSKGLKSTTQGLRLARHKGVRRSYKGHKWSEDPAVDVIAGVQTILRNIEDWVFKHGNGL
jgi:hypothetical protein